ncbi:MAG: hypothetical protein J7647_27555 [Cyanobacteria bacterium SBLK]|nr:hypothetical protein [Cyanobacteria bacterium SBLK]
MTVSTDRKSLIREELKNQGLEVTEGAVDWVFNQMKGTRLAPRNGVLRWKKYLESQRKSRKQVSSAEMGTASGINGLSELVETASDRMSDQASDAIHAKAIVKTMQKMGNKEGPMTQAAYDLFENAMAGLETDIGILLPGEDSDIFLLSSAE